MTVSYNNFYALDSGTVEKLRRIDELRSLMEYRSALSLCTKPKLTIDLGELKEVNTFTHTADYLAALTAAKEIKLKLIDERIAWLINEISNKGETNE